MAPPDGSGPPDKPGTKILDSTSRTFQSDLEITLDAGFQFLFVVGMKVVFVYGYGK